MENTTKKTNSGNSAAKKQTQQSEKELEIEKQQKVIEELEKQLESIKQKTASCENSISKTNNKLEDIDNEKKTKTLELERSSKKLNNEKEINNTLKDKRRDLERQISQINNQRNEENEESELNVNINLGSFLNLLALSQQRRQQEIESRQPGMSLREIEKIKVDKYKQSSNENEEKCKICGFELCNNDYVMTLPKCKHIFHKECLVTRLQTSGQCPLCKTKVTN